MTDRELERASEVLLRNYLRNYKLTQDRVPYIVGSFNILDSYELNDKNLFPSGVVALAQSTENGGVLLEHVFTANKEDVLTLQRMLLTGLDLKLDRTLDLSAIINVKRLKDGRLQFTAVPVLYGSYASSTGPGHFLSRRRPVSTWRRACRSSTTRWSMRPIRNTRRIACASASTGPRASRMAGPRFAVPSPSSYGWSVPSSPTNPSTSSGALADSCPSPTEPPFVPPFR